MCACACVFRIGTFANVCVCVGVAGNVAVATKLAKKETVQEKDAGGQVRVSCVRV